MTDDDVRQIGYLPEERGLYKKMKVGEQALYLARLKGLSRSEAEKRLSQWFDKFDITETVSCLNGEQPLDFPQIASNMVKRLSEKRGMTREKAYFTIKEHICFLCNWYPSSGFQLVSFLCNLWILNIV